MKKKPYYFMLLCIIPSIFLMSCGKPKEYEHNREEETEIFQEDSINAPKEERAENQADLNEVMEEGGEEDFETPKNSQEEQIPEIVLFEMPSKTSLTEFEDLSYDLFVRANFDQDLMYSVSDVYLEFVILTNQTESWYEGVENYIKRNQEIGIDHYEHILGDNFESWEQRNQREYIERIVDISKDNQTIITARVLQPGSPEALYKIYVHHELTQETGERPVGTVLYNISDVRTRLGEDRQTSGLLNPDGTLWLTMEPEEVDYDLIATPESKEQTALEADRHTYACSGDFEYEYMDYADSNAIESLRQAYSKIDYSWKFPEGSAEKREFYIEKYYEFLNDKILYVEPETRGLCCFSEAFKNEYKGHVEENIFCFFDINEDDMPELGIADRYSPKCEYIFQYDEELNTVSLWQDMDPYVIQGSKVVSIESLGSGGILFFTDWRKMGK